MKKVLFAFAIISFFISCTKQEESTVDEISIKQNWIWERSDLIDNRSTLLYTPGLNSSMDFRRDGKVYIVDINRARFNNQRDTFNYTVGGSSLILSKGNITYNWKIVALTRNSVMIEDLWMKEMFHQRLIARWHTYVLYR